MGLACISMLQVGGNRKFIDFCAKYNVPKDMGIKARYNTPVAASYKDRIKALSEVCSLLDLAAICRSNES